MASSSLANTTFSHPKGKTGVSGWHVVLHTDYDGFVAKII